MEYDDVIWDNEKHNLINKLGNIQVDAARTDYLTWLPVWRNQMGKTER